MLENLLYTGPRTLQKLQLSQFLTTFSHNSPHGTVNGPDRVCSEEVMKRLFYLLALAGLVFTSGCVIREGRGGDYGHHWRGYGHEEHWEHHRDWH
jgi:hypothetical protein